MKPCFGSPPASVKSPRDTRREMTNAVDTPFIIFAFIALIIALLAVMAVCWVVPGNNTWGRKIEPLWNAKVYRELFPHNSEEPPWIETLV